MNFYCIIVALQCFTSFCCTAKWSAICLPIIHIHTRICESQTIEKAQHQRIDAFELWCWRRLESPLDCKEIQPVYPKGDQSWMFIGRTDAEAETPILRPPDAKSWPIWKDPDAGKDWRQEERERDDRGWDGWMVSPTRCTWVWINSGSWWWTGRPGELQFMGSQRVGHDWVTELSWTHIYSFSFGFPFHLGHCRALSRGPCALK